MRSDTAAACAVGCGVGLLAAALAWGASRRVCSSASGGGGGGASEEAPPSAPVRASAGGRRSEMTIDFKGRTAMVTGAARGIGREIAAQLLACNAKVVAVDVNEEGLADAAKELGADYKPLAVNLLSDEAIAKAVAEAGDVDFLVNSAGVAVFEPYFKTTRKAYDLQFGVNVRGLMELSQQVADKLRARMEAGERVDNAAIVNVSSQSSTIALVDHLVYSTTKAAVDHITRISSLELAPYGIRVNAVNPTVVRTQLAIDNWGEEKLKAMASKIPLQRIAEPVDVARAVAFLLSDQASMITGVTLRVDGGFVVAR